MMHSRGQLEGVGTLSGSVRIPHESLWRWSSHDVSSPVHSCCNVVTVSLEANPETMKQVVGYITYQLWFRPYYQSTGMRSWSLERGPPGERGVRRALATRAPRS